MTQFAVWILHFSVVPKSEGVRPPPSKKWGGGPDPLVPPPKITPMQADLCALLRPILYM